MESVSIWHWVIVGVVLILVFGSRLRMLVRAGAMDSSAASWALALPRGDTDTYTRAEQVRADLARRFRYAAVQGVALTAYESARGSGEVWLRLEVVKPDPERSELSLRSALTLAIERFDFHRFEHVLSLQVARGTDRRTVDGLIELADADISPLMAFATGERATFPRLQSPRLRQFNWQLWRPRNRIERVRRDWLALLSGWAGWALLLVGLADQVQFFFTDEYLGSALLLLGAAVVIARWAWLRRRHTLVLNAGKPRVDPRSLVRMDSWQVTLNGLGERQQAVQDAILRSLAQHRPPGVTIGAEWIGYASVDSKVEREQHVVTFRRGIAFLRLEAYGRDLYVGWDSHINAGVWQEEDIGQGLDRVTGKPVVARRVVKGWQTPSEYDLSDSSFLTEWLHTCIVGVIKQQLAEYRIDQEIDFTIQRESRADALQRTAPGGKHKPSRFGGGMFKRTA